MPPPNEYNGYPAQSYEQWLTQPGSLYDQYVRAGFPAPKPEPTLEEQAAAKLRAIEAEHRQAHRRFSGEVTAAKPAPKSVLFNGQEVNPVLYDAVTRPEPVTLRAGEVLYSIDYGVEAVPRETGDFIAANPDWVEPPPPRPPEPGQWQAPLNQERDTPF